MDPGWAELADELLHGWGALLDNEVSDNDGAEGEGGGGETSSSTALDVAAPAPALKPSDIQVPLDQKEAMLQALSSSWMPTPLASSFDQVLLQVPDTEPASLRSSDYVLPKVAAVYCNAETQLHTSKAAVAQLAGITSEAVEPSLNLLSNTLIHLDRQCRAQVHEQLLRSAAERILFLDICRYDETPLRLTFREELSDEGVPSSVAAGGLPDVG